MPSSPPLTTLFLLLLPVLYTNSASATTITRQPVISQFNPRRNASSSTTPIQLGNGNFAFGADITGLQTFLPFNTLSSWGWHNSSLPTTANQTSPEDFTGLDWWTHGRFVNYDQPNPAEADISQWLIANPHRVNLGMIGFVFFQGGGIVNFTEEDLSAKAQVLDLYSGTVKSEFTLNGTGVRVQTAVDPEMDTLAVKVSSELLGRGQLGFFFDYPYATGEDKFEAPFVGDWDAIEKHRTEVFMRNGTKMARIMHQMDSTVYYTHLRWNRGASIRAQAGSHRYILQPDIDIYDDNTNNFEFTATFSPSLAPPFLSTVDTIHSSSASWWKTYWETGAFIDLTGTANTTALELQRRIILSQYLLAVNEAGKDPPQESGLVNNGWYGKFHMEMYLWHSVHWIAWDKISLLERSIDVYERFLETSIQRAKDQGYAGARWGKMSDPSGRSAPGEINSLLIWQQPHVFYFAETEYQHHRQQPQQEQEAILQRWDSILTESANFMTSFAFWNESTEVYDLGPPMYPASENTPPNSTTNPTFELAYWRFGLDVAIIWKKRLQKPVPEPWMHVRAHLAPLPTTIGTTGEETYTLYSGIRGMWTDPETVMDHPALIAIYGLLPPPASSPQILNMTIVAATAAQVARSWNFTDCWGWDFPMLAMNAARLGDVNTAVEYLVHGNFGFDDVGMPVGPEAKAPTPYFPGSGGLLLAVGMLAGDWGGGRGMVFPEEWKVRGEGFRGVL